MHKSLPTLMTALSNPERAVGLPAHEWSELIATARSANLLGMLAERLHKHRKALPVAPLRHLDGARMLSERQRRSVRWECHQLRRALSPLTRPVILLKGAAYVMEGLPNSQGRLFGDIDILVPKDALAKTEVQLMLHGWTGTKDDSYDQRYYRDWMHELPPMTHVRRGTVLDVHHTILPPITGTTPNISEIYSRAKPLENLEPLHIPCPEDLVIHCITHFAYEGELNNGLRDLFDIDGLLRHFMVSPGFWSRLTTYAIDHQLAEPVAIGLTLVRNVLGTAVPDDVLAALTRHDAKARLSPFLNWCYRQAIGPLGRKERLHGDLGRLFIFLRSHALRMPLPILVPHLFHKALRRYRPTAGDRI